MREGLLMNGARVELVVRVDAAHFLLGSELGDALQYWSHVDIRDLDSLVALD